MPPSPLLSARMMKVRYLTVTTIVSDQKISDRTPSRSATAASAADPRMHSLSVYSGLVPMSPKTTPSAPRQSSANGA